MTTATKTIRSGYKQTELGVIPEDWQVSKVGKEFEIQLGKMLDAEKNTGVPKPYLGNKAVQWNRIDISDLQTIAMSRSDLERFRLRYGDLLVCEGGEVGRAAIWESPIEECYYQKALHRLRPLRSFNPHFMLALLLYWTDHGKLSDYISQTSIAHLTREKLIDVPMPVPPFDEQQAIATVLNDVDSLIASLDKLITKKRDIKQATMQQLLTGKTRLPGFSDEWSTKYLRDISFMKGRIGWQGLKQSEFIMNADEPYLITGMNFKDGKIRWDEVYHVSNERYEIAKDIQLESNDILMTKDGTIGKLLFVDLIPFPGKATLNSHLLVLRPIRDSYDPKFLYYQLASKAFKDYIELSKSGSTFFGISQESVGNYAVFLPPTKSEQTVIATILSDMDAEIATLEQRRDKTRALKQGMMQELLTGKTRLL